MYVKDSSCYSATCAHGTATRLFTLFSKPQTEEHPDDMGSWECEPHLVNSGMEVTLLVGSGDHPSAL